MSSLGLIGTGVQEANLPVRPQLHIVVEDTIATSRRMWLRGRLDGCMGPLHADNGKTWWERWLKKSDPSVPPPAIRLSTRVGGCVLEVESPVQSDGSFEALLHVDLPPARRGWRIARHVATCGEYSAEACSVVLQPPPQATAVVAVPLPLEFTLPGGAQRLTRAKHPLTPLLHEVARGLDGPNPVFYLAAADTPPDKSRLAELALAATTLGWPAGTFLALPFHADDPQAPFATALDRLRWLFAGHMPLIVLQDEQASFSPAQDRADVRLISTHASPPAGTRESPSRPEARSARPTRAGLLPHFPVVFCHGMLAFSMLKMRIPEDTNCFAPLRDFLSARGFRILYPQVPPTSGVAERADSLREQIRRWTDEPVNLVAHSMGGLDARHMICHLGMAERVRSLTTVCTPHRGTFLAEWFLEHFRRRVPLLHALEALGANVDGFRDCIRPACREFNERTPDRPEVRYFSYGGAVTTARLSPTLRRAWTLLTPIEGPNDGMVSLSSARWGEYLGTLHADHFAQTPDAAFVRPGEDFDSLGFYSRLVEDLARRGF